METPLKTLNLVLKATFSLHSDLLEDEGFAGYDGTKEQFDDLYEEVFAIVTKISGQRASLPTEDEVLDTYWSIQTKLIHGNWPCLPG